MELKTEIKPLNEIPKHPDLTIVSLCATCHKFLSFKQIAVKPKGKIELSHSYCKICGDKQLNNIISYFAKQRGVEQCEIESDLQ